MTMLLFWTVLGNLGRRAVELSERKLYRPRLPEEEMEAWKMERLEVGDRVCYRGWQSSNERDRFGTVVELYQGAPSAIEPRINLVAVKWDDTGRIERGYIQKTGSLVRVVAVLKEENKPKGQHG